MKYPFTRSLVNSTYKKNDRQQLYERLSLRTYTRYKYVTTTNESGKRVTLTTLLFTLGVRTSLCMVTVRLSVDLLV